MNLPPTHLEQGDTLVLRVAFLPAALGGARGEAVILSDAMGAGITTVGLRGIGVASVGGRLLAFDPVVFQALPGALSVQRGPAPGAQELSFTALVVASRFGDAEITEGTVSIPTVALNFTGITTYFTVGPAVVSRGVSAGPQSIIAAPIGLALDLGVFRAMRLGPTVIEFTPITTYFTVGPLRVVGNKTITVSPVSVPVIFGAFSVTRAGTAPSSSPPDFGSEPMLSQGAAGPPSFTSDPSIA